jgi:hypothetical protein
MVTAPVSVGRRILVGVSTIAALGALGWWAAHGNCEGRNHLEPDVGLALGASVGAAFLLWVSVDYRGRLWPLTLLSSVVLTGYVYAMLMLLTEPVLSGAACEPNYKSSMTLLQTGTFWGLFMGTFFFVQSVVLRWWSRRSPPPEGSWPSDRRP